MRFEEFVDREFPGLARFAGALTGDRHLAEDVLSEALMKVSLRWRRVVRATSPLAYTRRVITTTYFSQHRRAFHRREVLSEPSGYLLHGVAEDPFRQVDTNDVVRQLLGLLTPSSEPL